MALCNTILAPEVRRVDAVPELFVGAPEKSRFQFVFTKLTAMGLYDPRWCPDGRGPYKQILMMDAALSIFDDTLLSCMKSGVLLWMPEMAATTFF